MKKPRLIYHRYQMSRYAGHNFPVAMLKMSDAATLTPEHAHTFYELVIITEGSGVCKCCGKRHLLKAGNVFLIPPGERHAYIEQKHLELINVLWDSNALPVQTLEPHLFQEFEQCFNHKGDGCKGDLVCIATPWLTKAVRYAESIGNELNAARKGCLLAATGHLCSLIALLCRCDADFRNEQEGEQLQMERILNYLELHYDQNIERNELAKMLHVSMPTFYRRFLASTGMSFREYLQRIRLSHAENLLRNSFMSIAEIAHRVGFSDSNHFATQFHRRFGMPPTKYRQSNNGGGINLTQPTTTYRKCTGVETLYVERLRESVA